MAQHDLGKVSIRPRGAYAANTNYEFLDSVQNLGGSWLALAASKDVQPGVTAGWQNYWMMITRGIKTIVGSSPADGQTQITITFTDGATATYTYNNEVLADGSVTAAKLAALAVETAKIKDGAVTRAKLAQDALYSPIRMVQSDSNVVSTDISTTIRTGGSASAITVTLTQDVSHAMPIGAEIAFLPWVSATMKIAFDGVKVGVLDQTQPYTSPTFTLTKYGMVAIKKILSDSNGDYWLLTGPAEVV